MNLPAPAVALLQYSFEKLHLIFHGVPVAKISSLEASRWKLKHNFAWVIVRTSVKIDFNAGKFALNLLSSDDLVSCHYQCPGMEGLHSELDIVMDTVQKVKEALMIIRSAGPEDEYVKHVPETTEQLIFGPVECHLLRLLHVEAANHRKEIFVNP